MPQTAAEHMSETLALQETVAAAAALPEVQTLVMGRDLEAAARTVGAQAEEVAQVGSELDPGQIYSPACAQNDETCCHRPASASASANEIENEIENGSALGRNVSRDDRELSDRVLAARQGEHRSGC